MKMPEYLEPGWLAPCGMNCLVCYRHCAHKRPCAGCRMGDKDKPGHCRVCAIKDCAGERGLSVCYACPDYPCKRIKALEKSYRTRYGVSLMENGAYAQAHGLAAFMEWQRTRYTCPVCGGILSLHDAVCSDCGEKAPGPSDKRT